MACAGSVQCRARARSASLAIASREKTIAAGLEERVMAQWYGKAAAQARETGRANGENGLSVGRQFEIAADDSLRRCTATLLASSTRS